MKERSRLVVLFCSIINSDKVTHEVLEGIRYILNDYCLDLEALSEELFYEKEDEQARIGLAVS